jgi:hypothetical protein
MPTETPTPNKAITHRAAGNLAFLLSVIRCGESLSPEEEASVRSVIQELETRPESTPIDKTALEPKAAEIVESVFAPYVTHLSARTAKQLAMEAIGLMLNECLSK